MEKITKKFKNRVKTLFILLFTIIFPLILNLPLHFFSNGTKDKFDFDIDNPQYPLLSSNSPIDANYFSFYKNITIDHTKVAGSGSLSDFPFLLSILDSDLHDDVQPDGDDIAFAIANVWLDHEIELFDPTFSPTEAQFIAWIRIPSLSTSIDTVVSMYYGNSTMNSRQNPSSVWDNDYKAIWHMSDNPSGMINDSTVNDNDGTTFGGMDSSDQVSSKIGGGISLDGINDYILIPHSSSIDITGNQITLEAWINLGQVPPQYDAPIIVKAPSDNNERYMLGVDGGTSPARVNQRITASISGYRRYDVPTPGMLYQDSWAHISVVYDGTLEVSNRFFVYINGALISAQYAAGTILSTSGNLNIGRRISTSRWLYGIIDELRISSVVRNGDWLTTQFNNQNDPSNFLSVGLEQNIYHQAQIYAIDLYGNSIPNVNISMYNNNNLVQSGVTTSDGSVLFTNITQAEYNFTVEITSDIGNHSEIVNKTTILIDNTLPIIYLECNVSTNLFTITDVDGAPVDSGWVLVGNSTDIIQKSSVDINGSATFQWLNITPYQYNYSVYYQDDNYNPNIIELASGNITTPNSSILIQSYLTTVNFTILSYSTVEAVSGAKLKLRVNNTSGPSIVNLTTDQYGNATLRWLNSTGIDGNYSLQIEFFGANKGFNTTVGGSPTFYDMSLVVKNKGAYEFRISIILLNFETELISLNPTDSIAIEWGSRLKLRALFNVTKAVGYEGLLGPKDADLMLYQVSLGGTPISSGEISKEEMNEGRHSTFIETTGLESDTSYLIRISAQKSGYTIPLDLILILNIFRNNLELNQSENDDSIQSIYWSDNINMSVKPYGKKSEILTVKNNIFKNINYEFNFSIPDIDHDWNLSEITFNIYNISWNAAEPAINITILDPYGSSNIYHTGNHAGWDFPLGQWTGITLNLDKKSPLNNNIFKFTIGGTFDNTVDIIAEALLVRDSINIQYSKFNVTNEISILTENEGWAIKNITFEILNCLETSTWDPANLTILSNLNISTIEGSKYFLDSGDANGEGFLTIDDQIINPVNNQFLFAIESYTNITFNVLIKVEYIQEFYQSFQLETFTVIKIEENIINGGIFEIGISEIGWIEESATIWVKGLKIGSTDFFPSDVGMNMTIGGILYAISDAALGEGTVSLINFNKNEIFQAFIETAQSVNFTLSYVIIYSRQTSYEIEGLVSYLIQEKPTIFGNVQYDDTLRYYIQSIDTSLIDSAEYTIIFSISKDHYVTDSKNLRLIVLNRLTMINGETTLYRSLEDIYINDAVNFTFFYTDAITGENITNIKTSLFIWEKYNTDGIVIDSGQGTLNVKAENSYILDFTTENKTIGDYLLIATLEKDNYEYKNAMILLTINKREVDYLLGANFKDRQASVIQGNTIPIVIYLTDPTKEDNPLINASIFLTIGGIKYEIEKFANGSYRFDYQTSNVDAFFTSTTLRGVINISRENYISVEFSIIIVVEMQEIFPGIPTFYFLLIISAVIAFTASIVGYRVYKYAKIPTFVKRVRAMKKAIEGGKLISESLLYRTKNAFIGERVKDKWEDIGLSVENVLGIKSIKEKKVPKIERRISETVDRRKIKPIGLILMKWDERIGTEILAKYPEETTVSEKTLMQIYSTHEYSGEKGIITLTSGLLNIISYYTGPERGFYLVLLLNIDDDPDVYEGGMADILRVLLDNIDDDSYKQMLPSLFQRLSVYPSLSDEEILLLYYQDDMKRMIIENLRGVGAITKSELMIWLRDIYVEGFIDMEATLLELLKRDIVKQVSVKGIPSELIFLTNDIFMLRIPPVKLFKDPATRGLPTQFIKEYKAEITKFFQNYHPTAEDNLKIIEILINPQVYETLRLLRTAIVTRQDLEKLKIKGVDDPDGTLKLLWDNQMIKIFRDEKNVEYYALLSDFYLDLVFPKYLLTEIKTAYEQKSQANKVLIEYLKALEDSYFDLKSPEKS